ncbi:TetR/AcrR family transcriptional regulator [Falsibacillus albus]|nr:TetR/AcrR family transcriptional regulator [Falsibacillus albus]
MNGFERRRQQKMNQIRQAAFSLFSKYGIQKVSIQDIAKKANVSQVTIYNYFGSKDELLLDALKEYFEEQLSTFEKIKNSSIPFTDKIKKIFAMKLEATQAISSELMESLFTESGPIADLIQYYTSEKTVPQFMEFLDQGKELGVISNEVSIDTILLFLDSMTLAIKRHPQLLSTDEKMEKTTKEILHFFFYGMVVPEKEQKKD